MGCNPLVSVIIPAYNAEKFIQHTLESVLAQTYTEIEVIVVDDGSRDRTAEIVEFFAQQDSRIQLFKQPNAGVAAARNFAIEQSKGKYIAPIDADDIWYPQKLEKQVRCIEAADESVGLVYAWSVYLNAKGEIVGWYTADQFDRAPEGQVFTTLLYFNFLDNASTPLFRRSCIDRVGGYNCGLKAKGGQGCEDWDIYLRIAAAYQFRAVPEYLVGYRQYWGSMATNCATMARSYLLMMEGVQQRHADLPDRLYRWSNGTFYNYLFGKSYTCGDYQTMFVCLACCLQLDPAILLRPGVYKAMLVANLYLIRKWMNKTLGFVPEPKLQRIEPAKGELQSNRVFSTRSDLRIEDINQSMPRSYIRRPYDWVFLWRLNSVMRMAQPQVAAS